MIILLIKIEPIINLIKMTIIFTYIAVFINTKHTVEILILLIQYYFYKITYYTF